MGLRKRVGKNNFVTVPLVYAPRSGEKILCTWKPWEQSAALFSNFTLTHVNRRQLWSISKWELLMPVRKSFQGTSIHPVFFFILANLCTEEYSPKDCNRSIFTMMKTTVPSKCSFTTCCPWPLRSCRRFAYNIPNATCCLSTSMVMACLRSLHQDIYCLTTNNEKTTTCPS